MSAIVFKVHTCRKQCDRSIKTFFFSSSSFTVYLPLNYKIIIILLALFLFYYRLFITAFNFSFLKETVIFIYFALCNGYTMEKDKKK